MMEQQFVRWLHGLSSPMVALNSGYGASFYSPSFYEDSEPVDLKESWNIGDRADLFNTIFRMADDGHAEELSEGYFLRVRMLEHEWQSYVEQQNDHQQTLLKFVAKTSSLCGGGGIRAWDLARMSFLARIGVLNQFISEQESLWIHFRLALRARYYYTSWQNYCAGYIFGRYYWQNLDIENPAQLDCLLSQRGFTNGRVLKELVDHPDSPLVSLPWYIDFQEIDKPESLEEVNWS
jgi:hypothetical protein